MEPGEFGADSDEPSFNRAGVEAIDRSDSINRLDRLRCRPSVGVARARVGEKQLSVSHGLTLGE
jgi:hypothetical protein